MRNNYPFKIVKTKADLTSQQNLTSQQRRNTTSSPSSNPVITICEEGYRSTYWVQGF